MPEIADLPDPTTREFTPYVNGAPPSRILIGRVFLGKAYWPVKNDKQQTQYDYIRAFIEQVEYTELPYREIVVSWNTLSTVVTALRSKVSDDAAMGCIEEVTEKEIFNIVYPEDHIYQDTISDFKDWNGNKPNINELSDYLLMVSENIDFVLTWDKHFTVFPGIILLPHSYW